MRSCKKNKQKIYYSLYGSKVPILDENGDPTGDFETGYSMPVSFFANISAGKGTAEDEVFGKGIDFTRAISSTNMELPIDEFSRLWFETEPKLNEDGTVDGDSADYTVAATVARSRNSLMIAIKKRNKGVGG